MNINGFYVGHGNNTDIFNLVCKTWTPPTADFFFRLRHAPTIGHEKNKKRRGKLGG